MTAVDMLIPMYLEAIEVEGKTPNTIYSYRNSLEHFRKLGRELLLPEELEQYRVEDVYRFLGAMKERGASARFRHRRQHEIRSFFSWCRRMNLIEQSVFAQVPLVKFEQKIRQPFSKAEIEQLLSDQDRLTHVGARNYGLVLFLLDTGVRATECANVQFADVDWDQRRILIRLGKGQKQRYVAMSEPTASALQDYIERFRGSQDGPLFLTTRWLPLRKNTALHQIISRLGDHAGVAHAYPHRFRHTFATWAITSGAREIDVQILLGHTTPYMTQRYARTYTSTQAVLAHEQLSPVRMLAQDDDVPVRRSVPPRSTARGDDTPMSPGAVRVPAIAPALWPDERMRFEAPTVRPPGDWRCQVEPGLTLTARHRGRTHSCRVVERDGVNVFVLEDGAEARSASGAARLVTGYEVSGYRFWQPTAIRVVSIDLPRDCGDALR